jgi:hypothetical protein
MVGTRGRDFRATCGPVHVNDMGVTIGRQMGSVLGVKTGDTVRMAPLRPTAPDVATAELEYAPREREGSD